MTDALPDPAQIPDVPAPEELREASDAGLDDLDGALRAEEENTRRAMEPWQQRIADIKARRQLVATERRRRQRAEIAARRKAVRADAASGAMPTLPEALASGLMDDGVPLKDVKAFLSSGGAVGFGFATRPGTITFTNGTEQKQALTWGEAGELFLAGWEPGSPSLPGVRVHLAGTRNERVVAADQVVIERAG